jgi:hypothetical protein
MMSRVLWSALFALMVYVVLIGLLALPCLGANALCH